MGSDAGCSYRSTGRHATVFCRLPHLHDGPHQSFLGDPQDPGAIWVPPGVIDYGPYGKYIDDPSLNGQGAGL